MQKIFDVAWFGGRLKVIANNNLTTFFLISRTKMVTIWMRYSYIMLVWAPITLKNMSWIRTSIDLYFKLDFIHKIKGLHKKNNGTIHCHKANGALEVLKRLINHLLNRCPKRTNVLRVVILNYTISGIVLT